MSVFFADFQDAMIRYATDEVQTAIVDFAIDPPGGATFTVGNTFTFKVTVQNQGPLDMENVQVRVFGTDYADVALIPGPFLRSVDSSLFNVPSGTTEEILCRGKAKGATGGVLKDIVKASVIKWDASLNSLLNLWSVTQLGESEGKLTKSISLAARI